MRSDPHCRQTVKLRKNLPITDYRDFSKIDTEGSADSYQRKMVEPCPEVIKYE